MSDNKKTAKDKKVIALAGNPNVGKSTIFNALTGMNQHTGNWTGKTVANACGECHSEKYVYQIVDIPGTYSLSAHSKEEEIARDFLCSGNADAVVVVCDSTCLERNLNLVLQILGITDNVILCVNLMDEAKRKGIEVDTERLEGILGIPVISTIAKSKKSCRKLIGVLDKVCDRKTNGEKTARKNNNEESATETVKRSEEIADKVIKYTKKADSFDRKADRLFTGRLLGFPVMLMLFMFIFWLTVKGANYPSEMLWKFFEFLKGYFCVLLKWLKVPSFVTGMIVDGVYNTLARIVSVMLPPMAIFFPLFTILEDMGYLPRIAFNLDKPFKKCNACGKQALTMCMGFGCNAVGVTGCRIIDSPRERLLAVLTNNFVPCNGRFPTLILILTMFFVCGPYPSLLSAFLLTLVIIVGIAATMLITKFLSKTFLKGEPSSYILELPPYRKPQIGQILIRSVFDRTLFVLGRAVVVAAPAGLVLWLCGNVTVGGVSVLNHCAHFLDPLGRFMGLDGVILIAFILGFPANEIVVPIILMAYTSVGVLTETSGIMQMKEIFIANGWNIVTAINMIIFTLFHWPCSTTMLTIKKETGSFKWTLVAFLLPTILGILCCMSFTAAANLFLLLIN